MASAKRFNDPRVPELKQWPGLSSLASAAFSRLIRPGWDALVWRVAIVHRRRMRDTTFIGVTGSAGKTTTKFMIGAVLATRQKGGFTPGTYNNTRSAARSLLRRARKGDDFHVVELSAGKRGALDDQLALIRPRIGVVTNIGTDHSADIWIHRCYRRREGKAAAIASRRWRGRAQRGRFSRHGDAGQLSMPGDHLRHGSRRDGPRAQRDRCMARSIGIRRELRRPARSGGDTIVRHPLGLGCAGVDCNRGDSRYPP